MLVLGDGMADWLAYGLEDAYAEQPDMGVIRKHKTVSGLIKYQPKGEPADWAAAAKGILATEKPDAIVVMLGLNDRVAIREPAAEKSKATDKKDDKKDARAKPDDARQSLRRQARTAQPDTAAKPDDKPVDTELSPDDAADNRHAVDRRAGKERALARTASMNSATSAGSSSTAKKIEEMIGVLKSKGVPVLWVGLPAVRGVKGTADMLFLDALYRDAAGKAGITYVDVWDGFVDEAGRFLQKGPDFEGQIRQLRSYDGVYFTKPGARKLAHYVEREITRLLAARSGPIALPTEPATPDANAVPGQPAPRPLAGPILPLVASSVGTDQLLGGPGSRPAAVDALAARTLVKGEPLAPPAGRADDFAWPRREIGREQAKGETPVASDRAGSASTAPARGRRRQPPNRRSRKSNSARCRPHAVDARFLRRLRRHAAAAPDPAPPRRGTGTARAGQCRAAGQCRSLGRSAGRQHSRDNADPRRRASWFETRGIAALSHEDRDLHADSLRAPMRALFARPRPMPRVATSAVIPPARRRAARRRVINSASAKPIPPATSSAPSGLSCTVFATAFGPPRSVSPLLS